MTVYRAEYPRPDFVRKEWLSLNGTWDFAFADGAADRKYVGDAEAFDRKIEVPFVFQSQLSGIGDTSPHEVVWYRREFTVPKEWQGQQIKLHFGAVDYESTVWVNGQFAGTNKGGYVPFSFDITELLVDGTNTLVVQVIDRDRTDQPKGKQSANLDNWGCWYTRTTGIWQSVWLEPVASTHISHLRVVPDIDNQVVDIEYYIAGITEDLTVQFDVTLNGELVSSTSFPVSVKYSHYSDLTPRSENRVRVSVPDCQLWSPENPVLYDLKIILSKGESAVDTADTYFGMRKVEARGNKIYLNNRPYYLRMVLDQGFWPTGICTPEKAADYEWDVQFMKDCGFNGVRKHQKIEDPYFYYYCDKMGLLVWAEMPSRYIYDETGAVNIIGEWQRAVRRLYNFPSIMAWVPMNESWGVEQLRQGEHKRAQAHLDSMYYTTKALDETRLVVSNDGWQHATTDIITIHDYTQDHVDLTQRYQRFQQDRHETAFSHGLPILLPDYDYKGQPIMMTEYGGVKVEEQEADGWGYGQAAKDYEEMLQRMKELTFAILEQDEMCGYCYTQLTDVQQEVNGLATFDRKPKVATERFKEIFGCNKPR